MDRFKLSGEIAGKGVEMQFDLKKMPGEKGPTYMVSIDGLFRGYVTKGISGSYVKMFNSDVPDECLLIINEKFVKV
ncbi:hypothetical protein INP83_07010 [Mucilaginibacter sp. 21P]|uniref:hypothetical protein n=1 Tax=Mucilaginibacter sp. 21P TaxID=2778902 RepID=UPI001C55BCD3|nr:hypothetical protein [Mucilaginibacter sp. 21P]QXV66827.1 hypothetical protein INP83_07010 [Mucilaginibacter sp. 21P]